MAGMDWFRWHHGSVTDPKFRLVARKTGARVADVIAVWAVLLEAASQAEDRGNPGALDFEAIDCALGLDDGQAQAIHAALGDREIINKDGSLAAWDTRQPKREREDRTGAGRQAAFRAKKNQVTPSNAESHQKTPREEKRREEKDQNQAPAKPAWFDPLAIELPESIPLQAWSEWITYRRTRKLTCSEQTMRAQVAKLIEWHGSGHSPPLIIATSIEKGWQGLFEPKGGKGSGDATGRAATVAEFTGAGRKPAGSIDGTAQRVADSH